MISDIHTSTALDSDGTSTALDSDGTSIGKTGVASAPDTVLPGLSDSKQLLDFACIPSSLSDLCSRGRTRTHWLAHGKGHDVTSTEQHPKLISWPTFVSALKFCPGLATRGSGRRSCDRAGMGMEPGVRPLNSLPSRGSSIPCAGGQWYPLPNPKSAASSARPHAWHKPQYLPLASQLVGSVFGKEGEGAGLPVCVVSL